MIKLIMLVIFVTWCYLPFLTIWCRANEHPRMFLCQVYIYRHGFSISWHSNVNVKMLFRPHIHDIGRIFGSHLGEHLVCNRIWNLKFVIK